MTTINKTKNNNEQLAIQQHIIVNCFPLTALTLPCYKIMGNSAPAPAPHQQLSQKQIDLKYLAERLPFGDEELQHLYTVYHDILLQQSEHRRTSSFLVDWGVQCGRCLSESNSQEERETLLQVVDSTILPTGWSHRLYSRTLCVETTDDIFGYSSPLTTLTDEWTRKKRLETFFEGIANSGRRGANQSLTVLFNSCKASDHDTFCKPLDIVSTAYKLALATSFMKAASDDTLNMADYIPTDQDDTRQLQALASSMLQRAHDKRANNRFTNNFDGHNTETQQRLLPVDCITLDELIDWCDSTGPLFGSILPTFLHQLFFPGRPYPPSRTAYDFPYCLQESGFFESARSPLLFTFGCFSSALEGAYFRLYTSDQDGLSFNRLLNALLGYNGPTLVIIRSTTGGVFGAFTASQWKESKDFYGLTDCFLYQMSPKTAVYRPTEGTQRHFMYCNPEARSKGYDKQAHGLGFGGTVDQPRLFLAENFDDNVALSADLTFENGPLLPPREDGVVSQTGQFLIDSLEVWGVGGDDIVQQALSARDKVRAHKDEGIRRARKVDKAQFLDDFRSGVIASKAFAYKDQIDGRADQDVNERNASQNNNFS